MLGSWDREFLDQMHETLDPNIIQIYGIMRFVNLQIWPKLTVNHTEIRIWMPKVISYHVKSWLRSTERNHVLLVPLSVSFQQVEVIAGLICEFRGPNYKTLATLKTPLKLEAFPWLFGLIGLTGWKLGDGIEMKFGLQNEETRNGWTALFWRLYSRWNLKLFSCFGRLWVNIFILSCPIEQLKTLVKIGCLMLKFITFQAVQWQEIKHCEKWLGYPMETARVGHFFHTDEGLDIGNQPCSRSEAAWQGFSSWSWSEDGRRLRRIWDFKNQQLWATFLAQNCHNC